MAKVTKIRKIKKVRSVKPKRSKPKRTSADITVSKAELFFGIFCKRIGIELEEQFQIGYKFYDFKVKGKNILVEFDGSYYHGDPKLFEKSELNSMQKKNMRNDKFKDKLAAANGYKLIRIWENDFNSNPNEVKERLLKECV